MPLNVKPFGWQFIDRQNASASATIDFALPNTYLMHQVLMEGVYASVDDREFWVRFSDDNAVSYEAGATDYEWGADFTSSSSGTPIDVDDNNLVLTRFSAGGDVSDTEVDALCGQINIFHARDSATYTQTTWATAWILATSAQGGGETGRGRMQTASDDTHIRFLMETGNITAGSFILMGLAVPSA